MYQRLYLTRQNDLFSVNLADAFASLTSFRNLKEIRSFSPKQSLVSLWVLLQLGQQWVPVVAPGPAAGAGHVC